MGWSEVTECLMQCWLQTEGFTPQTTLMQTLLNLSVSMSAIHTCIYRLLLSTLFLNKMYFHRLQGNYQCPTHGKLLAWSLAWTNPWLEQIFPIVICAHDHFPIILTEQHAHALELLSDKLTEGASALDVGSGSGYLTACFARMVSSLLIIYQAHTSEFFSPVQVQQLLFSSIFRQDRAEGWLELSTSINWLKCQWKMCKLMTQNYSPLVELSSWVSVASCKFWFRNYIAGHRHQCMCLCSGRRKAWFSRGSTVRCHSCWRCCTCGP